MPRDFNEPYYGFEDENERPAFDQALASLKELGETISDIVLYAATQGIEKARPTKVEASHSRQEYSITQPPPCQSPTIRTIREEARR